MIRLYIKGISLGEYTKDVLKDGSIYNSWSNQSTVEPVTSTLFKINTDHYNID